MAYNTPESVADYLSRFQMQVTELMAASPLGRLKAMTLRR